jgi:hypothetical protein
MRFPPVPAREPKPDHETPGERNRRNDRNRLARQEWERTYFGDRCARCGMVRANVVHETDPVNSSEGMDYFSDMLDQLHEFVP